MKANSGKLIHEMKRPDHLIQVRENWRYRWLYFGGDNIQSAMHRRKPYAQTLAYMQPMLGAFLFKPTQPSALLLGLGAGSLVRYIRHYHPDCRLHALEIDPAIVDIAKTYFALPAEDAHFRITITDAKTYITEHRTTHDILFVDIFNQTTPPALYTQSFYEACYQQLNETGVCVINLVCDRIPEFLRINHMIRRVFHNQTLCIALKDYCNIIVYAFRDPAYEQTIRALTAQKHILKPHYDLEFGLYAQKLCY